MSPLISVVLPIYNSERFLPAAMASVLSQDFPDFELLAINDGSSDNSGAILDDFAAEDQRVTPLHRENGGLVSALNLGLRFAKGRFIARMDHDDISHPERFSRQIEHLTANPRCVALGTAITLMSEKGEDIRVARYPTGPQNVSIAMIAGCVFAHPTVMMRTEAVLKVGGYREALANAEDYDLWLRLLGVGDLDNLGDPLLRYRQHPGQISNRFSTSQALATSVARQLHLHRTRGQSEPLLPNHPISIDEANALDLPQDSLARIRLASIAARQATLSGRQLRDELLQTKAQSAQIFQEPASIEILTHVAFARIRSMQILLSLQILMIGVSTSGIMFVTHFFGSVRKRLASRLGQHVA